MLKNIDRIKRMIKYTIMTLLVALAALSIPKEIMKRTDALLIGIVSSNIFVILDLVFP